MFSGDTTMSDALVELAAGADVLVHEVVSVEGAAAIVERLDPATRRFERGDGTGPLLTTRRVHDRFVLGAAVELCATQPARQPTLAAHSSRAFVYA